MTYPELQYILDKERIGCGMSFGPCINVSKFGAERQITGLYITDSSLFLFPLKERIESILEKEGVNARVNVNTNEEILTIELINEGNFANY